MSQRSPPFVSIRRRSVLASLGTVGVGLVTGMNGVSAFTDGLTTGERMEIEADPDAGFSYPYLAYVPESAAGELVPLLLEPNNTGFTSDDIDDHRDRAESRLEAGGRTRQLCDELGVPALVPIFPRPASDPVDWRHYTHALDRQTLEIENGPLERIDLQLLAMAEDLRSRMAEDLDIETLDRYLMNGFSASGNFVNRFSFIHPDRVLASIAGGINGTCLLPTDTVDGTTVEYHVGVADLDDLTGTAFDHAAWQKADQFIYLGGTDDNDTIPYGDAWSDELRELALEVYGEHMQEDRMPTCREIYEEAGFTGWLNTYPDVGHRFVMDEMLAFFERHVEPVTVTVLRPPSIGESTIDVDARSWPEVGDHEIRVFDSDGDELTESPAVFPADAAVVEALDLRESLSAGDEVTVAAVDPSDPTPDGAVATTSTTILGTIDITEAPQAGDTTVGLEAHLAEEATSAAEVRLVTEAGSGIVVDTLEPGNELDGTFELPEDGLGVPLVQGHHLRGVLVEPDERYTRAIASTTTTIASPDEIVVEIDSISFPEAVGADEHAEADITIRLLGAPTSSATVQLTLALDGETIGDETAELDVGARETITVPFTAPSTVGVTTLAVSVENESTQRQLVVASEPADGNGTNTNPYLVEGPFELAYAAIDKSSHYTLNDDIDIAAIEAFPRLGTVRNPFRGTLDGRGHTISNLKVELPSGADRGVGLFGGLGGSASVRHLVLENAHIDEPDANFVGLLAGRASRDAEVERVRTSGHATGNRFVGGIIGGVSGGNNVRIRRCSSTADLVATSNTSGGIVGQFSDGIVDRCYFTGSLLDSGGLGGGIVGQEWFGWDIHRCFAAGPIDSGGGLVGQINGGGQVHDSYWDSKTTGQDDSPGGGTPLTTDEMTGEDAPTHMTGLDFDTDWVTTSGYPTLAWEADGLLEAVIRIDPTHPEPGDEITFDATASIGEIEHFSWESSTFDDFPTSGEQITYVVDEETEFEVSLTVTAADGETDTTTIEIAVAESDPSWVEFTTTPRAGHETVTVSAGASDMLSNDSYRVRVGTPGGEELGESPLIITPGETIEAETVDLVRPLTEGEEVTVVLMPPGGYRLDSKIVHSTVMVQPMDATATIAFTEEPRAGDESVFVTGSVETNPSDSFEVRIGTSGGVGRSATPHVVSGGESFDSVEIALVAPLVAGETVIGVVQPPGEFNPEIALGIVEHTVEPPGEIDLNIAEPATAGEDTIVVDVAVPDDRPEVIFQLRVVDGAGEELTIAPPTVEPGDAYERLTISLSRLLEEGEEVTIVVQVPGELTIDDAETTATTRVEAAAQSTPSPTSPTPDREQPSATPGPGIASTVATIVGIGYVLKWFGESDDGDS